MLEDFLSYIESNLSVFREDKILLSVSGGVDSMVMLHLFNQLEYDIAVAHINHSTRNGQSDVDMAFIEAHCKENSIPFYSKILNYKQLSKGNFQENARKARFSFLSEIQENKNCKWVALAHHKNDRWETFLMNLNRKSGIRGLTSLRAKEQHIIHPLLIFTKAEILAFAAEQKIDFVHDSSNDTNAYKRNAIRHQVTPEIVDIYPDFVQNVNQSILHLDEISSLLTELIGQNEFLIKRSNSDQFIVDLPKVKSFRNQKILLYQILNDFGFNYSMICDILKTDTSGTQFEAEHFEGLFDRGSLIIRTKRKYEKTLITIGSTGTYSLFSRKNLKVENAKSSHKTNHLWLDKSKIKWPLIIRNIESGDKFKPHGMKGATKSLKKLLTDLKINRFDKEEILLVCQGNEILQVIGIRTRNNYSTSDIKNALTFSISD